MNHDGFRMWEALLGTLFPTHPYGTQTVIGTHFRTILDSIPQSEKAFDIAKEAIIANIRTQRITKSDILFQYLSDERMGIDYDTRRDIFEQVLNFTLKDVVKFQEENVRNSPYTYCVLGDENTIDFSVLKAIGEVKRLSQKDIFGY